MMCIENNRHIELWVTTMKGEQWLKLNWCSFSRWGREYVAFAFSSTGSQYFVYVCVQGVAPQITQDTPPTMVDTQLTVIVNMVQEGYCSLFC